MKKLDRYVTINYIKSITIGIAAFTLFYFLSDFFRVISPVLQGDYSINAGMISILELLPSHIVMVAPVGVLIGCLMFTNKMASSLEIIALKTSGISLKRIMIYPIIVTFILSCFLLYVNTEWAPKLTYFSNNLQHRSNGEIKESPILNNSYMKSGNFYYYFQQANVILKTFTNMEVVEVSPDFSKVMMIFTARSGEQRSGVWTLHDVTVNDIQKGTIKTISLYSADFINIQFKEDIQRTVTPESTTPWELYKIIGSYNFTLKQKTELLATFYEVFAFPFMSFFTCFLGFALGSRYVRGGAAVSIALAVVIGYGFFIINSIFITLAGNPRLPTIILVLCPKIIALIIGIYFMAKAEH
ncbi:MAG: LptF/LptG family permease [Fusobacteria bacterium]|nr:LptF/LptG family permease [Fusobacteriota bacterium]